MSGTESHLLTQFYRSAWGAQIVTSRTSAMTRAGDMLAFKFLYRLNEQQIKP